MDFGFETKGLKELDDLLGSLPVKIENKVLQNAVTAGMTIAKKNITAAAPVHGDVQSAQSKKYGTLKSNIKLKKAKAAKGGKGSLVTTNNAFWGFFLERGTKKMEARPWMLPAFALSVPAMISKVSSVLKSGIEGFQKK